MAKYHIERLNFKFGAIDFTECLMCSQKSGSPTLCQACLDNRAIILELGSRIEKLTKGENS